MAKKHEVVDTWGRLAGRVNSQAATKSPQFGAASGAAASARKAYVAEADAGEANAPGGGAARDEAKESPHELHGPELDDVD
jgi:hypothetical protein